MRSRLVLGLAVVLAACSGGGGSGTNPLPHPQWGNFRQGNANSGANGTIDANTGKVSLPIALDGVTLSTPTIDLNNNVLIGTAKGVVAYAPGSFVFPTTPGPTPVTPSPLWTFTQCTPPCSTPPCPSISVGPVSAAPTVSAGGTVVVGTDGSDGLPGRLFAFQEPDSGASPTCLWVYPPLGDEQAGFTTRSSAAILINSDLTLSAAIVGSDDGRLRVFNPDGTVRWTYPTGAPAGRITSSPAVDSNNQVYVTAEDGTLAAVSFAGREVWTFQVGFLPGPAFQASPAVATTTYAIGVGGTVYGINPNGTQKWMPAPKLQGLPAGSPAFLAQSFNVGSTLTFDTIVYVVDEQGTAYGLRDLNGSIFQLQRCMPADPADPADVSLDCMRDSCLPNGGVCNPSTNVCSISGLACTPDSCTLPATCQIEPGIRCITDPGAGIRCTTGPGATVANSPAVSGDPFVVVATTDARVCARNLDGNIPGEDLTPQTPTWMMGEGCIQLPASETMSSPIIGVNGVIYVTTDAGIFAIQ